MSHETANRPWTLLRTAAGSTNTVTQYRTFRALGCRIVAADCDSDSVGFQFADAAHTVPKVADPSYLDRILDICRSEAVDLFLPALDEELELFARHRDRFEAVGTRLLVSSPEALAICLDKFQTYQFFKAAGISTPRTIRAESFTPDSFLAYPVIVKPRAGRGSTGVYLAHSAEEAVFLSRYVGDAVIQTALEGVEYTIDVLADMDSEVLMLSPRVRLATDSGISSKGVTHWRDDFLAPVRAMVKGMGLVGPLNVQCFVSPEGTVAFTEINARMAGTAVLSQAAGVPFFQGILSLARGEQPDPWLHPCEPLMMYRYWEEVFLAPRTLAATAGGAS